MRKNVRIALILAGMLTAGTLQAQDRPLVQIGRPMPIAEDAESEIPVNIPVPAPIQKASYSVVRGQVPDLPPPPGGPVPSPFGPSPGGGIGSLVTPEDKFNCGVVNNDADRGGFFSRFCDKSRRCWIDLTDGIGGRAGRQSLFLSDHDFDNIPSPVTNPFYFEDPRALTELRPIFTWQRTNSGNPTFSGGNNYFATLQGRLAVGERMSIVVNKLGWVWSNPDNPSVANQIQAGNGFGELHLGPKFTIIRNPDSKTLAAIGVNFEVPIGSGTVAQNTNSFTVDPYFSFAQNFLRSSYGSFNFLGAAGYAFGMDQRTDFVHSSLHLSYDVGNFGRFFPLVELNYWYYTGNGNARNINFEGKDLFNFGAQNVNGQSDMSVALGARFKVNDNISLGLAGEYRVIGSSQNMDNFRVTTDLIWRY